MRRTIHAAAALGAAMIASLALSGCPIQPSYPSTITPIYAAESSGGLWVYNGTSWTNHALAGTSKSVVVLGSGAGGLAYVGGSTGVSRFNGTAWTATTGLGSSTRLFSGPDIYAATPAGVAILNSDGLSWTNNNSVTPVNDVFSVGTYTLVAGGGTVGVAGLYVYNGANLLSTYVATDISGSTDVLSVFVDPLGDLFAGTNSGLFVLSFDASFFGTNVLPSSMTVNQITMDQSGNIYAVTSPNGLYIIGTSAVLILPGAVHCVCVDGSGTIYAGTDTGLQVSTNGGQTWTTKLSTITPVNSVTTTAPLYSF